MEILPVLVFFVLGGLFIWWWGGRRRAQLASGLAAAAPSVGLTMRSEPDTDGWLAAAPPLRLLASGTAKRVLARGDLAGGGEVLIFSKGSQAGSNRTYMYAIFAESVTSSVTSFSLVAKDLLDTRRSDPSITLTPLPGWDALAERTLWMHTDPTRHANGPIPQHLLTQCGNELVAGSHSRVEFVGGTLVHYVPVTPTFAPEEIQALVARGRSYAALLRSHG